MIEAGNSMKSAAGPHARRMDRALVEVKKYIHEMDPDLQFAIIFYDSQVQSMPGQKAVKATDINKGQVFLWADQQGDVPVTMGSPDLLVALQYTRTTIKPKVTFVLTAGDFPHLSHCGPLGNPIGASGEPINVINFGAPSAEVFLRQIAQASGGTYQFTPDIPEIVP
jgi:hypothetical protein